MRVLHTYPFTHTRAGGIAACLPPLLQHLNAHKIECEVLTQVWQGQEPISFDPDVRINRIETRDASGWGWSPQLKSTLQERLSDCDVIHSHGLWMWMDAVAASSHRRAQVPHIITPHGMLEPWALERSVAKKKLLRRVFQDRALREATYIHALTESEAAHIRKLGFEQVAVVPNGVDLRDFENLDALKRADFDAQFPACRDRRLILFMARLHPKKGLEPLIEAWSRLSAFHDEWHLVIAGPDENGYRAACQNFATVAGVSQHTTFTGLLTGHHKKQALAAAEVFVLPSWSEGFSMAILEAMAAELPVLLTPGCNFPRAVQAEAAFECLPYSDSITEKLQHLLKLTQSERENVGKNGKNLIKQEFLWDKVAHSLAQLYSGCLNTESRTMLQRT